MIYTCYEMIRDCRAGLPEGWRFFLRQYVPVMRGFLAHYFPDRAADPGTCERVLAKLHQAGSSLFESLDPAPERAFVAELRQHLLAAVEADRASAPPEIAIDLQGLQTALDPLTLTERLVIWLQTMRYPAADTARMLRMSPQTAEKIRARGSELLRSSVDAWSSRALEESGAVLGQAAHAARGPDCPPPKTFFDVIDGRATWRGREEMERHVKGCLHCIDHYSRLLEVVDVLRLAQPLPDEEAQAYERLLGIQPAKRGFWRR